MPDPRVQFTSRKLDPILLLTLSGAAAPPYLGDCSAIARISELDPRIRLSIAFAIQYEGTLQDETGLFDPYFPEDMIRGNAYPIFSGLPFAGTGTPAPELDDRIIRPNLRRDGKVVTVFGTTFVPAVQQVEMVLRYENQGPLGWHPTDKAQIYALAEIGINIEGDPEEAQGILGRVRIREVASFIGTVEHGA